MINNLTNMLKKASEKKFALGSFNVYNYETIKGVFNAIKETSSDGIIAFGAKYTSNMELNEVANLIRTISTKYNKDIAIHLDHCADVKLIKEAIEAGFTSVMYDGSHLPFEENMKQTKEVCEYAHARGVTVEAELGSIALGGDSNEDHHEEKYTDPVQAARFVKETGVDCLAISIGTVHGTYKGTPNISVDRLKEIRDVVDIPLVLHGGSGTPVAVIKECIENGICKININTEMSKEAVKLMVDTVKEKPGSHFSQLSVLSRNKVTEVAKKHIELFAS
ncbi:MAG: class II fructose-bisphosphate aldolase [Candidatus Izemoplasmataceae bacterium]